MKGRRSGILLHISSLPSPYGIGDMGPEAYRFADFLVQTKQSYWQVLPVNPTLTAYGNSPYSSTSVFAGNPLFISPVLMLEEGFIDSDDLSGISSFSKGMADYKGATGLKNKIIYIAYHKYRTNGDEHRDSEFRRFCEKNSEWLDDYALFAVLKTEFGGIVWNQWPEGLRDRKSDSLEEVNELYEDRIAREKFSQYIFFKQWYKLKEYCNSLGIRMIGDLPIYPNFDSADVWANQDMFKLDHDKKPEFLAGVPPDYFSSTGQLWGNPVYDWEKLKKDGFSWWTSRMEHNLSLADIVRIDHFRGIVAYWQVPQGNETAVEGEWVDVPCDELFGKLQSGFEELPVIAEDLGTITPDVRQVMEKYGLPGMRVLMFAFGDDFPEGDYLPHNYIRDCVVYTGTHDNNTSRGWYRREATEDEKSKLSQYTGINIDEKNVSRELARLAMQSVADTVILPMQDILDLDESARMNTPSTNAGNWCWRLKKDYYKKDTVTYLSELTWVYER